MAARSKFRPNLLHRIIVANKNFNARSCCATKDYSTWRSSFVVRTEMRNWNRLCHSSTTAAALPDVPSEASNVKGMHIAVCIERLPVLTPGKNELELEYEALQELLELEHSSISDHELRRDTMAKKRGQLKKDEDNEKLKKEVALLESEYQELKDIEEQHIKDVILASRTTEADKTNKRTTPYRKLEEPLFLLTPNKDNPKLWQLPEDNVEEGETLRQAAERIANGSIPNDMRAHFMSNAPAGVYRKAEKDGAVPGSAKVFFYQARLQGTVEKYSKDSWSNCVWVSKAELLEYLPSNYYQSVLKFIL